MPSVERPGAVLAYRDEGDGPAVLLLSGLGATAASLDPLTAHLPRSWRLPAVRLELLQGAGHFFITDAAGAAAAAIADFLGDHEGHRAAVMAAPTARSRVRAVVSGAGVARPTSEPPTA